MVQLHARDKVVGSCQCNVYVQKGALCSLACLLRQQRVRMDQFDRHALLQYHQQAGPLDPTLGPEARCMHASRLVLVLTLSHSCWVPVRQGVNRIIWTQAITQALAPQQTQKQHLGGNAAFGNTFSKMTWRCHCYLLALLLMQRATNVVLALSLWLRMPCQLVFPDDTMAIGSPPPSRGLLLPV